VPFSGNRYSFDVSTLRTVNQVGAVYGLFQPAPFRPGHFICLYVGQTNDLRTRLNEHYNNPPVAGVTHFYAEVITTEQQRKLREKQLIAEFSPPGNQTRGG
jgi:GIY-YIG catalytic domain